MKKVVVISDSFKGTLSSREICDIARESVPRILPGCAVTAIPVADGGEGTVSCFLDSIGASPVTVSVQGPYGETVDAVYARKGNRAIIEMASAAGLPMVGSNLDPERTTTNGVDATSVVTADATWSSSEDTVATVSAGTATGVKEGTVTITATYTTTDSQELTASAELTVNKKPNQAGDPTPIEDDVF